MDANENEIRVLRQKVETLETFLSALIARVEGIEAEVQPVNEDQPYVPAESFTDPAVQ